MSTQTISQAQLLSCNDAEFDKSIKGLAVKELMGLISLLQKEMAREQDNFNNLSAALQGFKDRSSRQYKSISRDMMAAQAKLTTLMNRSMKCFSQQNLQQQQDSQSVQLRRRNSSKAAEQPSASPTKSASVQRSRSLHSTNQPKDTPTPTPTPTPTATTAKTPGTSTPAPSALAHRGGLVSSYNRVEAAPRPASVVGEVNGVVANSKGGNPPATTTPVTAASGKRVSLGYVPGGASSSASSSASAPNLSRSSSSLSCLSIQPQVAVMGVELTSNQRRSHSRSQLLVGGSSPAPKAPHSQTASSPFTHAASQPSLVASPRPQPRPSSPPAPSSSLPASSSTSSAASPPEKSFNGLPSVRQLAQTFGGKAGSGPASNPTASSPPSTNYRPVIRAQSVAACDASRRSLTPSSSASSSKVNGIPLIVGQGGRVQGQYVKRGNANKAPVNTVPISSAKSQTELEKIQARIRTSKEINLSPLPDKPAPPTANASSSSAQNRGDREVTVLKTNLDRQKSNSSIVLGQKTDFDEAPVSSNGDAPLVGNSSQGRQMNVIRRAQSREELYAIESQARVQKDAMLKEIGGRKAEPTADEEKPVRTAGSMNWGLKGTNFLAKRLKQDEQEREELKTTAPAPAPAKQNEAPRQSSRVSMQMQPSLPNGSGGGPVGGGGLMVSIRSSSRENLADPPPSAHKLPNASAKIIKTSPFVQPLSSSTTSSAPTSSKTSSAPPKTTTAVASARGASRAEPIKPARVAPVANRSLSQEKTTPVQTVTSPSPTAGTTTSTTTAIASQPAPPPPPSAAQLAAAAAEASKSQPEEEFADLDDENTPRMNLINWNPRPILDELYKVRLIEETAEDISHQFISMEGLMEKLPMNKKKSTLLKTWKRRFFRAKDGWVQYFETGSRDKPSETLQLMGGHIDDMGNRILGIDDGRGHYLMVRAPTDKEYGQWKIALESQTADNTKATYVNPVLKSIPHHSKQVVVIDMGSSAIRAGVLGENESLPGVMFPSVVAVDKQTGSKVVGMEAYLPEVRRRSKLLHPICPANKVDQFNIEMDLMLSIFSKVFTELGVDPSQYTVMLSTPQILSDSIRSGLMTALVERLGVQGVCMVQQSLLALYSYRSTTGIIVDIGNRIEILPIYDGFVIESGVSRCPYGSQKVIDSLKNALLLTNFKFESEVELLLVRHIMEQSCYVAYNYNDEETLCETQPGKLQRVIDLGRFDLPDGAYRTVEIEEGRFSSPEGFFNVDKWEMDYPTLHKLIFQAIQSCPMDNRRHMYRAVYLSGGVTMLPGFHDRLQTELSKLAPPAVTVEVHAAPNRYHAAYLGACSVAAMPQFKDMAITRDQWRKEGARAFKKWQAPAS